MYIVIVSDEILNDDDPGPKRQSLLERYMILYDEMGVVMVSEVVDVLMSEKKHHDVRRIL